MKVTKSQLRKIIKESILEAVTSSDTNALLGRVRTVLTVLGANKSSKSEELMATLTQAVHKIETDEDYKASLKALSTPVRSNNRDHAQIITPDEKRRRGY
tara:strand:- start:32888 stop:33187 length:300 start_codon:yes stop_codon:yes gene_type:complete